MEGCWILALIRPARIEIHIFTGNSRFMKNWMLLRLCFIAGILLATSCARPTFRTIPKPIVFDQERRELSLAYLQERYGDEKEEPVIEPKIIVLHWTAIPTLEASFNAMNPARLPGGRGDIGSAS